MVSGRQITAQDYCLRLKKDPPARDTTWLHDNHQGYNMVT